MSPDGANGGHREPLQRRLETFTNWLGLIRSLFLSIVVILTIPIFVYILIDRVSSRTILIEPIDSPPALAALGYTKQVLGQQLVEEVQRIFRIAGTIKDRPVVTEAWLRADVSVPGSNFTLESLARIVREAFGSADIVVRGEATQSGDSVLLQLRSNQIHKEIDSQIIVENIENIKDLLDDGAITLIREIDPFILASYYHRINDNPGRISESMIQSIGYCVDDHPTCEHKWAYNLWGWALMRAGKYDEALEKLSLALEDDPEFYPSHNNIGVIYLENREYSKAIEQFKQATISGPSYALAHGNLGHTYMKCWLKLTAEKRDENCEQDTLNVADYRAAAMSSFQTADSSGSQPRFCKLSVGTRSCTHKRDSRIGRVVIQASKLWEPDHEWTL